MLHPKLIALHTALGCKPSPGGVCVLYAEAGIDAFFDGAEAFQAFKIYNAAIAKGDKDIPALLRQANAKKPPKENEAKAQALSADERLACEIERYVKQGDQYFQPACYSQTFGKSLAQSQALHISRFAHPVPPGGERRLLFKTMNLYAVNDELTSFVTHLNSFAKKATANFAMSLGSDNHKVSLAYDVATKTWELLDINQPDCPPVSSNGDANQLVSWMTQAFNDAKTRFIGFCTKVYCRADHHEKLKPLADQLKAEESFKKLHSVTPERAKRANLRGWTLPLFLVRHGNSHGLASITDLKSNPRMRDVDLNKAKNGGAMPVFIAAQNGHEKALSLLVEAKDEKGQCRVDLNKATNAGATPAYIAAEKGHDKALTLLVAAKDEKGQCRVDLNKATNAGATPAYIAAEKGHDKALTLLVEAKDEKGQCRVDLNKTTNAGVTPVFIAAQNGHDKALSLLVAAKDEKGQCRVDLNQATNAGATAAYIAAENGHDKALSLLVAAKDEKGQFRVDLNQAKNDGVTPVFIAAQNGHDNALKILLKIEAKNADGQPRVNLDQPSNAGYTPAHIAAYCGHVSTLKILAEHGANLAVMNQRSTPLDLATEEKHQAVIDFFKTWDIRNQLIAELKETIGETTDVLVEKVIQDFHDNHQRFLNQDFLAGERQSLRLLRYQLALAKSHAGNPSVLFKPGVADVLPLPSAVKESDSTIHQTRVAYAAY